MNPTVTVIIPTYNRAALLKYSIQSVLNQDFDDFELLVIGDGCTDNSEAVVRSFQDPRVHWSNLSTRVGCQSGPNNEGIQRARGSYIAYLGHDDIWFPDHLSSLFKSLEQGNDFASSLTAAILPGGKVSIEGAPSKKGKLKYHFSPPSSWMHRKEVFQIVGPWRTDPHNLIFHVDREFFFRIAKHQLRMKFIDHPTIAKFPSAHWKTYKLTKFPQGKYFEAMVRDPQKLREEFEEVGQIHSPRRTISHRILWRIINTYGRENWPISLCLRAEMRKELKALKPKRGLE